MLIVFLIYKGNLIGDEGIISLSENLKYIPELIQLYLYNNLIEDKGIYELSKNLFYISNLEEIDIGSILSL